jgi:hypothetical protein
MHSTSGRAASRPWAHAGAAPAGEPAARDRAIEQQVKAILERGTALGLAADVANDAAESRAQEFEFAPDALELVGMRIAPDHDGGALGQAQIALTFDALAFGQIDQLLDRAVDQPRVGRMGDCFLLHGGVHPWSRSPQPDAPPEGSPATARRSAPHPTGGASASVTSDRTVPRAETPLRRRNIENTGSPPSGHTMPHRRSCASA